MNPEEVQCREWLERPQGAAVRGGRAGYCRPLRRDSAPTLWPSRRWRRVGALRQVVVVGVRFTAMGVRLTFLGVTSLEVRAGIDDWMLCLTRFSPLLLVAG